MIDQDIVLAKVAIIQRCLRRIRNKTGTNPDRLDDQDIQDIVVLNLQRAIQAAIDLAAHIVAEEELGLPSSLRENFKLLERAGIIPSELAETMQKMVGFRNIAIHEYQNLNPDILKKIVMERLDDLVRYTEHILSYSSSRQNSI